ncbi:hypothetical protein [Marinobacter similis]|uniref:Uncharacterized protein n=1 Tax=Marinobacter similis TaxID=1420916 RepID=W5YMF6_9GAMM|nr:hypothetical protein [Marinobacter similis]AHI30291.1 hypothetical protein AU14_17630 [Marinobacter similis]
MPYFDICFARPAARNTEQPKRVKAETEALAIEAYKRRVKDIPEGSRFYPRPISEMWRKKEQVARRLRKQAEGLGYTLTRVFDGEEWEELAANCSDRDYLDMAMCTDMTVVRFEKDFERLSFYFCWDNYPSECLYDHTANSNADAIARATIDHFEGKAGY